MGKTNLNYIIANLPGQVYWKDASGFIQGCNKNFAIQVGVKSEKELIGKLDSQMSWSRYAEEIRENDLFIIKTKQEFSFVEREVYLTKKSPLLSDDGDLLGVICCLFDESSYELIIEKNKSEFESLVACLPGHISWKDKDCVIQGCNEEQAKSFGLKSRHEIIGKTSYDVLSSDQPEEARREQAERTDRTDKEIMMTGISKMVEEEVCLPNSPIKTFLSNKIPLKNTKGEVTGLVGVSVDITDRKNMEIELMQSRKKIESANEAKSEFIANMSHDLRTPMAGLQGMLDVILFAEEDARTSLESNAQMTNDKLRYVLADILDKTKEYASLARDSSTKLNQLHNDILDNIELESGESKEVAVGFNLDKLLQSAISLQKPVAVNKKLGLTLEIDDGTPCHLKGLQQSLNRVLLNIISNALKFTEQGSVCVTVGLSNKSKEKEFHAGDLVTLKIQVKDTGIGIPSDKFDEIFGQFSRLTSSYQGTYKGLGLGLYVVKKYVDAMKGEINVESKMGEGACFSLLIPFTIEKEGGAELVNGAVEPQKNASEKESVLQNNNTENQSVLLVEDDKIAAMAVRMSLTKLGCQVDWVESGEEALEKVAISDYSLVFMDIGLPNKSGVEAASEIRGLADKTKAETPIVALTGHARGKIRQLCFNVGMQNVLSKPADFKDLEKALNYFSRKVD